MNGSVEFGVNQWDQVSIPVPYLAVIKKDRCWDLLKFKHKLSISSGGKNKHRGIPSPYYFFGISQILWTLIISKLIKISQSQRSTGEEGEKELLKFYRGGCELVLLMLLVGHVYYNSSSVM